MSHSPSTDPAGGHAPVAARRRIEALDVLRGFALCGIIFINIPQTMEMYGNAGELPDVLRVFVLGRFYPIFYLLFGVGFGIFLRSAARRTARPRLLLLRRFAALAVIGGALHLIQPGEVLLPFAVTGLVVLLPLSYLPGRALPAAGVVLTVAGLLAGVGGLGLLPGLFALGFAMADRGAADTLGRRAGPPAWAAAGGACVALLSLWLVLLPVPEVAQLRLGLLLSLSMAVTYGAVVLLVLRTPAGPALTAVLAPMGRMALTNYVTMALLFVPVGTAAGLRGSQDWTAAALLAAGILALQAVWSTLWLRGFAYGPFEWAWRCVTYWRTLPIRARDRRAGAAADGAR